MNKDLLTRYKGRPINNSNITAVGKASAVCISITFLVQCAQRSCPVKLFVQDINW